MPAGYSGTPLAKKLGLKDGMPLYAKGMPASVRAEIGKSATPRFLTRASRGVGAVHLFHTRAAALKADLARLRDLMAAEGQLWVSWPKKASGAATDITEDTIRELALPMGYVDIKVCAVDETWSGLKLVVRKSLR